MFDINTKVQWRTGGRGVFRIVKGTIIGIVKAGKLPIKSMQDKIPHGDRTSNRDRYIVEVKDGVFAWANVKTTFKQGEKMPKHTPRLQKGKAKKAKKPAKVKAKKPAKVKAKKPAKLPKVKVVFVKTNRMAQPKKAGGDKPKTTWYGIVDGKITSVRKVVCPEGFSKDKPKLPEAPATDSLASPPPAAPPAEPPPTGASPALPQAV